MFGSMLGGKGARVGNEVDMYVGQLKSDVMNLQMTLKQSDMIENQFGMLSQMAKASGDANLVMQFDMLKNLMDSMQNNCVAISNQMLQKLQLIDSATDKIQNNF